MMIAFTLITLIGIVLGWVALDAFYAEWCPECRETHTGACRGRRWPRGR